MGWLWLMFMVFAVLSNLMEKAAKVQRPADLPRKEQDGGSPAPRPVAFPPFFLEESEEEEEPLPVKEVNTELETAELPQLKKVERPPLQLTNKRQKAWEDEFDQASMEDLAFEEMTGFPETWQQEATPQTVPPERENLQVEKESEAFLSAIILAQVMARPDFKTVPWRRRL